MILDIIQPDELNEALVSNEKLIVIIAGNINYKNSRGEFYNPPERQFLCYFARFDHLHEDKNPRTSHNSILRLFDINIPTTDRSKLIFSSSSRLLDFAEALCVYSTNQLWNLLTARNVEYYMCTASFLKVPIDTLCYNADVQFVNNPKDIYLRSLKNGILTDNLDNLPTFTIEE